MLSQKVFIGFFILFTLAGNSIYGESQNNLIYKENSKNIKSTSKLVNITFKPEDKNKADIDDKAASKSKRDLSDRFSLERTKDHFYKTYSKDSIKEIKSYVTRDMHGGKVMKLRINGSDNGELKSAKVINKAALKNSKDKNAEPREISRSFLSELKELYNIPYLKEYKVLSDTTNSDNMTRFYYHIYLGGIGLDKILVENADIIIIVKNDAIFSINANLVLISPEMIEAAESDKILTENEIKEFVESDLANDVESPDTPEYIKNEISEHKKEPKYEKIERLVISKEPYIIYRIGAVWCYDIDAFTGNILSKLSSTIVD